MTSLFHRYYDRLYASKDYAGEVATVLAAAEARFGRVQSVLEVGCGTGNHSREFANRPR
jgi:hypothetical protein